MKQIFLGLILLSTLLTSCVVSKKKFDAMSKQKQAAIDSLALLMDKTRFDYEKQRQVYAEDAKKKDYMLDSLHQNTERLTKDAGTLQESLNKALTEYESERRKLEESKKNHRIKSAQIDSLQRSLVEKQRRLAKLESMIDQNKKEVNKLKSIINDALKSFDDSELKVYLKDGKVYVAMEEKLMFKTGSSAIDKRGKEAVIKLGKILENNTETEILIEGHTDNVGADKYNWKLSTERSLSVVDILTQNTRISPKRITASGRGMHRPVASNDTDNGKQKNRRIEIILVPRLDSLYKIMNE